MPAYMEKLVIVSFGVTRPCSLRKSHRPSKIHNMTITDLIQYGLLFAAMWACLAQ